MYDETSNYQLRLKTCSNMLIFAGMEVRDYCDGETFEAKCKQDQFIIIKSALYGRMSVGRCVLKEYGYIGCQENVTYLVNKLCSGRNECRFEVTANEFEGSKPCPDGFDSYLQIEFTCTKCKFWLNLILRNVWKV